ncbi:MAG: hypothetical protein WC802_02030 [Patescibacteria group bacterium]
MYFRHSRGMWIPVELEPGDRVVVDGKTRIFRAVKYLSAPSRVRLGPLRNLAMGLVQPRWERLWMKLSDGRHVDQLALPGTLDAVFPDGDQPLVLIRRVYGPLALGGQALEWREDTDAGRRILKQRSWSAGVRTGSVGPS